MPPNAAYSTTVASGKSFYRITSLIFSAGPPSTYPNVVNGKGAKKSRFGNRYNHPGATTIYLTEDLETCFAEKMFYFQRDVVQGIDKLHPLSAIPPFQQTFALWEIELLNPITDVADLNISGATAFFAVFPSLPLNPSRDYEHLKDARANIESQGHNGIVVGSSRVTSPGNMVVLFDDQSKNLASITPYDVEFRLIDIHGAPFVNHVIQTLDFTTGEVQFAGTIPAGGAKYSTWQRVDFNH
jgi:RES domain-containing protein